MDTQEILPQQAPTTPETTPKSKKPLILFMAMTIFTIIVGVTSYYLGVSHSNSSKKIDREQTSLTNSALSLSPTTFIQPTQTISLSDDTSNWKLYVNQKMGISFKYPSVLYLQETNPSSNVVLAFEPLKEPIPGQILDSFTINLDSYAKFKFDSLAKLKEGEMKTGTEMQDAVNERFIKIKNLKLGSYDAVEYIRDGVNYMDDPTAGRGPIGYEHIVLIKRTDNDFISVVNVSLNPEVTKQHDEVFNKMISTLTVQ